MTLHVLEVKYNKYNFKTFDVFAILSLNLKQLLIFLPIFIYLVINILIFDIIQ